MRMRLTLLLEGRWLRSTSSTRCWMKRFSVKFQAAHFLIRSTIGKWKKKSLLILVSIYIHCEKLLVHLLLLAKGVGRREFGLQAWNLFVGNLHIIQVMGLCEGTLLEIVIQWEMAFIWKNLQLCIETNGFPVTRLLIHCLFQLFHWRENNEPYTTFDRTFQKFVVSGDIDSSTFVSTVCLECTQYWNE